MDLNRQIIVFPKRAGEERPAPCVDPALTGSSRS